jgi:hypothetical protein
MTAAADKPAPKKAARSILATLAGTAFVGLNASGYEYGTETTIGIDAGLLRDGLSGAIAVAATFWPQFGKVSVLWKSLSNDPRVTELERKVTLIDTRVTTLEKKPATP